MKDKVAEWLRSLPGTSDVEPTTITIGKQTWEGAFYTQRDQRRCYLVGTRPTSHRKGNVCYRMPGDDRDWYVACYLDADVSEEKQKYHPFGLNWMMMPWTSPGKIDDWQIATYRRLEVTVS